MQLAEATVRVDLAKIQANTRVLVSALPGIGIVGVTKVTCGSPEVARAMLAGGAMAIGESRIENAIRLREAGITAPIWLIRSPAPAGAERTVRSVDVSAVSEIDVLEALDLAAAEAGRRHGVLAMVDVGDLREGMMPDDLDRFLDRARTCTHVDVIGLGASLTCYGAIVPDEANLGLLVDLAVHAESRLGHGLHVSAGSSTSVAIVLAGRGPGRIDNLRLGESIVLGVDPATREPVPGLALHRDALVLSAPVIECTTKPSIPIGTPAQDAFGNVPSFEDRGLRLRAIVALGRQDTVPEQMRPLDPKVRILGASSDHLVLDVTDMDRPPRIGEPISFIPGYSATLAAFTSPYVVKEYV